jgi:hypothetical protein
MVRFTAFIFIISAFLLLPWVIIAQSEQITPGNPPLAEPLVREGDLAVRLVEAFNLGTALTEAEAESILISIDIAPRNGWIADYPITPDIIGELQAAVGEAAESGELAVGKEAALQTLQDVLSDYSLSAKTDTSGQGTDETSAPDYPDSSMLSDYYYDEGPPVVTYYAPPPDYAYLYSWVSYPFWWRGSRFPGFFVRKKFHVWVHGPERGHGEYISNYFHDSKTDKIFRIDPMKRSHGGALAEIGGAKRSSPSAPSGAAAVPSWSQERTTTRAPGEFRGYGASGPSTGTRSSTFERSGNSSFERNASDRGFQSRSSGGQISGKGYSGGGSRDGSARGGGGVGGFHGGGGGFTGGTRH